jgi:hypothetical protein
MKIDIGGGDRIYDAAPAGNRQDITLGLLLQEFLGLAGGFPRDIGSVDGGPARKMSLEQESCLQIYCSESAAGNQCGASRSDI